MRAGLLTQTLYIRRAITEMSSFGSPKVRYVDYIKTKGRAIQPRSGGLVEENNEVYPSYRQTFEIRHYHKIDESMRVFWYETNTEYDIISIIPVKEQQKQILICEKHNS